MLLTADQVLAWRPCASYTPERVRELFRGGLTPHDVVGLAIPAADRLWALLHWVEAACGEGAVRLLACDYAEAVLPLFEREQPGDMRPRQAIEVARRFARGEATATERVAAWAAAWAAAGDAAGATQIARAVEVLEATP